MNAKAPSERTRVKRAHDRGHYDRETIHAILDAANICHIGHNVDGVPFVTPTFHWRTGDRVYWHGSSASRMIRASQEGEICLTVTHLDAMVLARSAFHHSANYRSVMVIGRPEAVPDSEKERHLEDFIEALWPGRWATLRPINQKELKATTVLGLSLDEASAKIRSGGPVDDEADYALPIWAGEHPLTSGYGAPVADPRNLENVELPAYLAATGLDKPGTTD